MRRVLAFSVIIVGSTLAACTGDFRLFSDPYGATVLIDDSPTPYELPHIFTLEPGRQYRFMIQKDGYLPSTLTARYLVFIGRIFKGGRCLNSSYDVVVPLIREDEVGILVTGFDLDPNQSHDGRMVFVAAPNSNDTRISNSRFHRLKPGTREFIFDDGKTRSEIELDMVGGTFVSLGPTFGWDYVPQHYNISILTLPESAAISIKGQKPGVQSTQASVDLKMGEIVSFTVESGTRKLQGKATCRSLNRNRSYGPSLLFFIEFPGDRP